MSEKRLLGWEPTETQRHEYDDAGRLVRTIVTREPEWDDEELAKMQGLALYESQVCDCGMHESLAQEDPDLSIELPVCPVCAGLAQQMRLLAANDEAKLKVLGEKPAPEEPRPGDGRSIRVIAKGD